MLVAFRQLSSHQCHYFNQVDNQYFSFSSPFFFFCLWVRPQERRVVIDLVAIIKEFTQVDRPLSYQWGLVRESWRIPSWGTIEWVDGHGTLLRNMFFFLKIVRGSSDDRMKH